MDPITEGIVTLTKVERKPTEWDEDDEDHVDAFPEFIVAGTITVGGKALPFERSVSMELDGRDAGEEHISGFDWDEDDAADLVNLSDLSEDLYNAIYASEAYNEAARAYHGTE